MTLTTRLRLRYVISDYLTINVGWFLFNVIRYYSLPIGFEFRSLDSWLFNDTNILLGQFIYPIMMLALYWLSGFYNKVILKSHFDEVGNTALMSLIGMLIIFFFTLLNDNIPERLHNFELMIILWTLLAGPCCIGRIIITAGCIHIFKSGHGLTDTLVIGTDTQAKRLIERINASNQSSYFNIIGFANINNDYTLEEIIRAKQPQALIIASTGKPVQFNMEMMAQYFRTGLDVYVPLDLYRVITGARISSVIGEPIINITSANIAASTTNLKRFSDVVISSLALIVLLPIFAIIAITIKLDSTGPVFYLQERVGYRKKLFRIIKFRTMYTNAEPYGPALSSANDPRITRVGRFLRKYRLDELPQFINVLIGQMSIVGPRPEREYYVNLLVERAPHYSLIHQVRPGITSWGMVKFGYAENVDEMLERLKYDLLYIENISLAVDMRILFHTVRTVLTGQGV